MRRSRVSSLLVLSVLASTGAAGVSAVGCSSSSPSTANPAPAPSGADAAATVTTYVLDGLYVASDADAGAPADPSAVVGDLWRFHDGRYLYHPVSCAAAGGDDDDDASAPATGDDDDTSLPQNLSLDEGCAESGAYAISADGTTLSLTKDSDGTTTTQSFVPEQTTPIPDAGLDDDGGVGTQAVPFAQAAQVGDLVSSMGSLVGGLVGLVKVGGALLTAVPCKGVSTSTGSDTGAMVRLASDAGFSCLQSQLTLPAFDIPAPADGGVYCTVFSQPGCTTSNYYGRRGVGFIYDEFISGSSQGECGFEYQPGKPNADNSQSNPRWAPYVRSSGYYEYGQTTTGATSFPVGAQVTLLCTVDGDGHLQMKVNGSLIYDVNAPHGLLETPQTFSAASTHAMRVSGIAWPETSAAKAATARSKGQYFAPYSCQTLNQMVVTYTSTLACTGGSATPSTVYTAGAGGNAMWNNTGSGIGYTLSPSSEVSESRSGASSTDTLFPGGG